MVSRNSVVLWESEWDRKNETNTFHCYRFSWANGLFGQMILDLNSTKPEILKQSFQ